METVSEISSALVARLMLLAGTPSGRPDDPARPDEKCGLLFGHGTKILRADPAANVAADPFTMFEIDPGALLAAHRASRVGEGLPLIGYYHTHPNDDAMPSVTDAACAAPDGKLWLIATRNRVLLFRAVVAGAIHGRFDPLAFDLVVGKHAVEGVGDKNAPVRRFDGDDV